MTSSNVIAEPAQAIDTPAVPVTATPEAVDGGTATPSPTARSPFELLPTGESFGVCDLDGVCS